MAAKDRHSTTKRLGLTTIEWEKIELGKGFQEKLERAKKLAHQNLSSIDVLIEDTRSAIYTGKLASTESSEPYEIGIIRTDTKRQKNFFLNCVKKIVFYIKQ
ncbi:MAG: hypothetical protein HY602_00855 [Parcubacteria group bacterium]|nr:hypothetical protein [Parcubacteria group bacterium]